jgi:hypothetical protein
VAEAAVSLESPVPAEWEEWEESAELVVVAEAAPDRTSCGTTVS